MYRHRHQYILPLVVGTSEFLLEQDLLAGSVSYFTRVETAGQGNVGYFEDDDIVSSDNLWVD